MRAPLLREADEGDEDLRGRLRVRKRAVARAHGGAEEVGERGEADARAPAGEQPPGQAHRVDDGAASGGP